MHVLRQLMFLSFVTSLVSLLSIQIMYIFKHSAHQSRYIENNVNNISRGNPYFYQGMYRLHRQRYFGFKSPCFCIWTSRAIQIKTKDTSKFISHACAYTRCADSFCRFISYQYKRCIARPTANSDPD